jgi:hypothetical protein
MPQFTSTDKTSPLFDAEVVNEEKVTPVNKPPQPIQIGLNNDFKTCMLWFVAGAFGGVILYTWLNNKWK